MKRIFLTLMPAVTVLLASCAPVDLNAPMPAFDTGVDPNTWAQIPAGEFYFGQHEDIETTDCLRDHGHGCDRQPVRGLPQRGARGWVTSRSWTAKKSSAFTQATSSAASSTKKRSKRATGFSSRWMTHPSASNSTARPSPSRPGYENHPMTMVTWFGAWGYCGYYD